MKKKPHVFLVFFVVLILGMPWSFIQAEPRIPSSCGDLYRQALQAYYTGNSLKAENLVKQALELNPQFGPGLLLSGKIALDNYSKTERYPFYLVASRTLELACQKGVDQGEAMVNYAYLHFQVGNASGALSLLESALERRPDDFWAWQLLPHAFGSAVSMEKYREKYWEFDQKKKQAASGLADLVLH